MHLDFWEIVVLIGLAQGVFFGITMLTKKVFAHSENNKYLAYSIVIISSIGINELLYAHQIEERYYLVKLLGNDVPWYWLSYVPMFVFFLKSSNHARAADPKLWLLTVPFGCVLILNSLVDLQNDFGLIDMGVTEETRIDLFVLQYFASMAYIVMLCGLSFFVVKSSKVSAEEKRWLLNIWYFNAVILLVWVIADFMPDDIYDNFSGEITYPVWICFAVFTHWLVFKCLFQLELAQDKSDIRRIMGDQPSELPARVSVNSSTNDTLQKYYEEFEWLMEKEKRYLDPDLSRESVAESIGISPSYLSKCIRTATDKNFTALVNSYRVETVKELLRNPSFHAFSILAIGLEAGFKSKSAFFDSFKKETGLSPSQYQLLQKEES